jgi:putative FmdB family regulatory protein
MPIYEYRCAGCGHVYSHLAKRLDAAAPACPECGADKPRKLFSTFSPAVASARTPACADGQCPAAARQQCGCSTCPLE